MENGLEPRNKDDLTKAIALAHYTVYKSYLGEMERYPLIQPTDILMDEDPQNCIRLLSLDELACKKGEDIFQKLSTVYSASMALGCNLIVMIDVERINAPAKIYIGVRNSGEDAEAKSKLATSFRTLKNEIKSNFPGTKFHEIPSQGETPELVGEIFGETVRHISSVSCVASVRDKTKTENKSFIQGIEKFIDAMQGNTYTAVFIAEPISSEERMHFREGYENLYSTLAPFRKSVWTYNENESEAVMESLSNGISKSVTEGTSHTQGHTINVGMNMGLNASSSHSNTESQTISSGKTTPTGVSRVGAGLSGVSSVAGSVIGEVAKTAVKTAAKTAVKTVASVNPIVGGAVAIVGGLGGLGGVMQGSSNSQGIANTVANTIGKSMGISGGINAGYAKSTSDTTMQNTTEALSETQTRGTTTTTGKGKSIQIESVNKSIEEMLKRIEEQLKRVQEGEDYGSYSCGAYFLSSKQDTALLASNTYRALMIGEGSSVESGAINTWNGNDDEDKVHAIKEYLCRFTHPIFAVPISETLNDLSDFMLYTPGTIVSGLELPLHLGLPTKSVYGLPVLEHAEFGRNVTKKSKFSGQDERTIKIGKIYHMGQIEKNSSVEINLSGLTGHTFITGATGSGKSNTIYKMLEELNRQEIHFLVVEPAKGEYKKVFGNREDVDIYGTNPKIKGTELLRINPFSFPENVHILEHLDRLVEIFNVCWPMYAAMPAILKDSIQRAYETVGWDIEMSENKYDNRIFPTFADVYKEIKKVLEESDYSQDNKGDYTGSLVTRLRSLTTGINGLLFNPDEISCEKLFRTNVIIDLSRIGSVETKALIMGILILKLQEYHMDAAEPNQKLNHVTVLEEAHNLLRKTSLEQSTEGSNLLGKSVEMLANSIAEMRTYGEGFVIADQSPGLLDMSVIRNTNTKIILRLPDYSDRELVGKAAGLNEDQIEELIKLDNGVAAIRQSEWIEPVLCQVDKFNGNNERQEQEIKEDIKPRTRVSDEADKFLLDFIMTREVYRKLDKIDIERLRDKVIYSKLDTIVKCDFLDCVDSDERQFIEKLRRLVFDFLHADRAVEKARRCSSIEEWSRTVIENLEPDIEGYSNEQVNLLLALIVNEQALRDSEYQDIFLKFTEKYREEGRVF